MKTSILTTSLACFGFAILPLQAEEGATIKPTRVASDQAAQNSITTYIIHVSGSG